MYVVAITPDMVEDYSDCVVVGIQCDRQSQNFEWIKWMGWWRFKGNTILLGIYRYISIRFAGISAGPFWPQ